MSDAEGAQLEEQPLYIVEDRGYETHCWIWQRSCNPKGYGQIQRSDANTCYAHRWFYEKHGGTYPEGRPKLDHLCRVRACVNPAHLEPVSNAENIRRGRNTKLTAGKAQEIRESSLRLTDLARLYGVTRSQIWKIKNGRAWV